MSLLTKKRATAIVATSLALILAVGSLAFFTDRAETSTEANAATITLDLTTGWTSQTLLPGQKLDLPSTITSTGNRAMDVKETFIITSDIALSDAVPAEYEIYAADQVEVQSNGSYAPKATAVPVATGSNRTLSADKMTLTYVLDPFIMTGGSEAPAGTVGTSISKEYVVLFSAGSDNVWQGATVKVDYIVEAKQHAGTDDSDWSTLATNSITGVTGKYVPSESESPSN